MTEPMTEADINRERTLAYAAGYEAGKADAAKETCVVLTEEEREVLEDIVVNDTYISNFAVSKLRGILTRSVETARPLGLTEGEREVLSYILADPCQTSWLSHADNETLRKLLARSAQPADTVTVRREDRERELETLGDLLELFRDTVWMLGKFDADMGEIWEKRRERTVAQAEAALAKGGE